MGGRKGAKSSRGQSMTGDGKPKSLTWFEEMANRRERARLEREEAQAIREQARARLESGELCRRDEAMAELRKLVRLVRVELDRATAYLDPGLTPEVRAAAEAAVVTTMRKLRSAIAGKYESA